MAADSISNNILLDRLPRLESRICPWVGFNLISLTALIHSTPYKLQLLTNPSCLQLPPVFLRVPCWGPFFLRSICFLLVRFSINLTSISIAMQMTPCYICPPNLPPPSCPPFSLIANRKSWFSNDFLILNSNKTEVQVIIGTKSTLTEFSAPPLITPQFPLPLMLRVYLSLT